MTDEEKAEEYCKNSKDFVKYTSETYKKRLKKAYLDGLTEGRKEKWHDLRKNPDDLPKLKGYYLVAIKNCFECTISYFNHSEMEFNDEVIAWCELPKFEE